jgi:hypothetical protein
MIKKRLLFIGILLFSLVYSFLQNNPKVLNSKYIDIYYTKSFNQELLCWGGKCYESVVQSKEPNLVEVKKPIFSISKKIIRVEDKFHNIDRPIINYKITSDKIFFVVNDAFLPSVLPTRDSGTLNRALNTVYLYSKKSNTIDKLFIYEDWIWIKDISPNHETLLLSNNYLINSITKKSDFIGNLLNFKWINNENYQAEYLDICPNNPNLVTKCEIKNGISNCDYPFDLKKSFYNFYNPKYNNRVTAFFITPENWTDNFDNNSIVSFSNFSPGQLSISYQVQCSYPGNPMLKKETLTIGGRDAVFYTYPYQRRFTDYQQMMPIDAIRPQYLAQATLTTQNHDLVWTLSINGYQNSIIDRRDYDYAIKEFKKILSTVTIQFRK